MKPIAYGQTDVGKKRQKNEDAFLINNELGLFAVADGVGGHSAGEVASATAVKVIEEELKSWSEVLREYRSDGPPEVRDVILNLIEETLQKACETVYAKSHSDPGLRGMGTTLSIVLARDSGAFIGHVGDSRVYLYREGSVHQLTEDHTLVNEQLKRGVLTRDEATRVSYQNVITRSIGHTERVRVDTLHMDLLPADQLILCSDGLHGYLQPGDVEEVLADDDPKKAPARFVDMANERGGLDNITVVVVDVPEDDISSAEELRHRMDVVRNAPLFTYLNYRELVILMNNSYMKTISEGEFITEAGVPGDELLILVKGEARTILNDTEVARWPEGSHFGEISLFSSAPRSATVQAVTAGRLLVIGREQFYRFAHRESVAGIKLLWRLYQMSLTQKASGQKADAQARRVSDLAPSWILIED